MITSELLIKLDWEWFVQRNTRKAIYLFFQQVKSFDCVCVCVCVWHFFIFLTRNWKMFNFFFHLSIVWGWDREDWRERVCERERERKKRWSSTLFSHTSWSLSDCLSFITADGARPRFLGHPVFFVIIDVINQWRISSNILQSFQTVRKSSNNFKYSSLPLAVAPMNLVYSGWSEWWDLRHFTNDARVCGHWPKPKSLRLFIGR